MAGAEMAGILRAPAIFVRGSATRVRSPNINSAAAEPEPQPASIFLSLGLSAFPLATLDRPATAAPWARDHRGVAQTRDGPAIFVDQHFSDAEAGWAVHLFPLEPRLGRSGLRQSPFSETPGASKTRPQSPPCRDRTEGGNRDHAVGEGRGFGLNDQGSVGISRMPLTFDQQLTRR
jgi:hypothetical protein